MSTSRRSFLERGTLALLGAAPARSWATVTRPRFERDPFSLNPRSEVKTLAAFRVEDGRPGAQAG